MADMGAQLVEVCREIFARRMPRGTSIIYSDGPSEIVQAGHAQSGNDFQINRFRAAIDASALDKGFAVCFSVYMLTPGQKKYRPVGWWQSPEIKKSLSSVGIESGALRLLRGSVPYPSIDKHYWGVVQGRKITEMIVFATGRAKSDEPDERGGFYHLVLRDVESQLSRYTQGGQRLDMVDFWELVGSGKLADLAPRMKRWKKQWSSKYNALVFGDLLFAEPKTWAERPNLQVSDLRDLARIY